LKILVSSSELAAHAAASFHVTLWAFLISKSLHH
jgi:hypothetical protein